MKRAAAAVVVLTVLPAVLAAAYVGGHVRGTDGCVLRSVDEDEYIRGNEAVLRSLPLPVALREAHTNTWTHGITAINACVPVENGPPYSSFITTWVFVRGPRDPPAGLDPSLLSGEWVVRSFGAGHEQSYCKGGASLVVSSTDDGLLLRVDHRGCARERS